MTVLSVTGPFAETYYVEERPMLDLGVYPPLSGLLLFGSSWVYRESNGVPGLQRGGGLPCLPPAPLPCFLFFQDPIDDQNCGHGSDEYILGYQNPLGK